MGKKELLKTGILMLIGAVVVLTIFYYAFKVDAETLKIISGFLSVVIIGLLGLIKSDKTDKKVDRLVDNFDLLSDNQQMMKNAIKDIDESFKHKKEIVKLCQQIENETSDIFDTFAGINIMLRDYIVQVNDVISEVIEKQYEYDFNQFDAKYFKSKMLKKVEQVTDLINYVMLDKTIFEKINDKVILNIKEYISELKYIKDLENGKRRIEFKEMTLILTKKIANHSIDIYNTCKKTA